MLEPPISPFILLNHFVFAEKYKLDNLLRTTLFRIENRFEFTKIQKFLNPHLKVIANLHCKLAS